MASWMMVDYAYGGGHVRHGYARDEHGYDHRDDYGGGNHGAGADDADLR